jgi:8-oxo-dGTP pyrophosphatase MutT (NUDIX family)
MRYDNWPRQLAKTTGRRARRHPNTHLEIPKFTTMHDDASRRPARRRLLSDAPALIPYLRERLAALDAAEPPLPSLQRFPEARSAAVLAPLYAVDGRPHLLFIRRSADLKSHSGEIAFPGGGHDPADPSLRATALREAQEELAIDPARVDVLGTLPRVFTVVSNYLVLPVVGWLDEGIPPVVPNPYEVAAVIEAPLAALDDPAIFHEELWTRNGVQRPVRFYDFGPHRIWGMTAHVLHTLLALLPPIEEGHDG